MEDVATQEAGEATVIILKGNSDNSFEFYYKSVEPVTIFCITKIKHNCY